MGRIDERYIAEVAGTVPLTPGEEHALAARLEAGDRAARERLATGCLRLGCGIAGRMAVGMGVDVNECIGAANLGLVEAAARFRPGRARFSTYAVPWIKGAVRRAARDKPLGGDVPDVQDGAPGPGEDAERRDMLGVLLAGLDDEQRAVVMMVFGIYDGDVDEGGLSRAEVGRRMGLSRGAVGVILKRALAGMRRGTE